LAALEPLATAPGVTAHSGHFPMAFRTLTAESATMNVVVEGRDPATAPVDQPVVTDGAWVRPGGVVLERSFADALGVHTGDSVSLGGRRLPVAGIAVTAARPVYPHAGWRWRTPSSPTPAAWPG
jgi:putative ABC transport system permease protein